MKTMRKLTRSFQYKNHANVFFCPLCSSQRVQRVRPKLTWHNHIQLTLLTLFTTLILFPALQWGGLMTYFLFWGLFDGFRRVLFKKEVPCPHCGFDASWYKRDVKMARKKVEEFWASREAEKARNSVAVS